MKIIIILTLIVYVSTAPQYSVYNKILANDEYKCPYLRNKIIPHSKDLLKPCDDFEKTQSITEVNIMNLKYSLCGLYYDIFQSTCKLTNETSNTTNALIDKEVENANKYNISSICKSIGNTLNSSKIHSNFSNTEECELFCKEPMSESVLPICQVSAVMAQIFVQIESKPKLLLPSPEISIKETDGTKTQSKPEYQLKIVGVGSKVNDPLEKLPVNKSHFPQNSSPLRNSSAIQETEHRVSEKTEDSTPDRIAFSALKKNVDLTSGNVEVLAQENEPTASQKPQHSPILNQTYQKPDKPSTPKPNQHQQTMKQVPSEDPESIYPLGNKDLNPNTSNIPGSTSDEYTTVKTVVSNEGDNPEDLHNDGNEPASPQDKGNSFDKQLPVPTIDTDMEVHDEYAQDPDDQDVEKDKSIVAVKPLNIDEDNFSAVYPNQKLNDDDSYFFFYFMVVCIASVLGYVGYHNKQKILAVVLEGRKGRRSQRRRPNSANYHKLDCNLEEAVTSSCNKNSTNVIY